MAEIAEFFSIAWAADHQICVAKERSATIMDI
jgi:hypothetical protein